MNMVTVRTPSLKYSSGLLKREQRRSRLLDTSVTDFLLSATLILTSFLDVFTKVKLGPISLNGLLTVSYAVWCLLLLLVRRDIPRRTVMTVLPGILLAVWAAMSPIWSAHPTMEAVQNISVLVTFVVSILLVSALKASSKGTDIGVLRRLPFALYLATTLFVGTITHLYGVQARVFALFAAVGSMWFASGWRFKEPGARLSALILVSCIGLSLSRTALISCVFLLPWVISFRPRTAIGWVRPLITLAIFAGLTTTAIFAVPALHDRFTKSGDQGLTVNGTSISTEGRAEIWLVVYEDTLRSPIRGLGAGSATDLVTKTFGVKIAQPHNDFLRIFHDYGLIGFLLWLLFLGCIFSTLRTAYRDAKRRHDVRQQRASIAAICSMLIVLLSMTTDNVIIYPGPMFIAALLIGNALGGSKRQYSVSRGSERPDRRLHRNPTIHANRG